MCVHEWMCICMYDVCVCCITCTSMYLCVLVCVCVCVCVSVCCFFRQVLGCIRYCLMTIW